MDSVEPAFTNPIAEGADPFVTQKDDSYYLCQERGRPGHLGLEVGQAHRPGHQADGVAQAPEQGWNSREVWAPELHYLNGRWYIYYAASDGKQRQPPLRRSGGGDRRSAGSIH